MKTKLTQKQIRFQALLLFFITFFLAELCAVFLYQNQLKEAKLKADYTAQTMPSWDSCGCEEKAQ